MNVQTQAIKAIKYKTLFIELVCYAYVLVYLYASVYKLFDYKFFVAQLELSPLLGGYAGSLAWLVPSSEIIGAMLLLVPKWRRMGMLLCTLIMTLFTIYITYILTFSPMVPCSCGGILATMGWREHLVFNSCFVAAGLWAFLVMKPKQ